MVWHGNNTNAIRQKRYLRGPTDPAARGRCLAHRRLDPALLDLRGVNHREVHLGDLGRLLVLVVGGLQGGGGQGAGFSD